MTDALTNEQRSWRKHLHLPKLLDNGERECWVTVLYDHDNGVDIVVGAATAKACIEAFRRLAQGARCDKKLVRRVFFRPVEPGYGFSRFRKAALLSALENVSDKG